MPLRFRRLAPGLATLGRLPAGRSCLRLNRRAVGGRRGPAGGYRLCRDRSGAPVFGLYAATFPLFAYALLGSSRQLITGPDAATCIMAATAVGAIAQGDPARYAGLMVALTFLTGLFYLLAGAAWLGFIANFLSRPILIGYLNGIALIIIVGQVPKLCGIAAAGDSFVEADIAPGPSRPSASALADAGGRAPHPLGGVAAMPRLATISGAGRRGVK